MSYVPQAHTLPCHPPSFCIRQPEPDGVEWAPHTAGLGGTKSASVWGVGGPPSGRPRRADPQPCTVGWEGNRGSRLPQRVLRLRVECDTTRHDISLAAYEGFHHGLERSAFVRNPASGKSPPRGRRSARGTPGREVRVGRLEVTLGKSVLHTPVRLTLFNNALLAGAHGPRAHWGLTFRWGTTLLGADVVQEYSLQTTTGCGSRPLGSVGMPLIDRVGEDVWCGACGGRHTLAPSFPSPQPPLRPGGEGRDGVLGPCFTMVAP